MLNGLHRKMTDAELKRILGKICSMFKPLNSITCHDSEDWDNLIDLGFDELGNGSYDKEVFEQTWLCPSAIPWGILTEAILANLNTWPGGPWESIACHHVPEVMHRDDFTPVSHHSLMRKFDSIGKHMEKCMGRKFSPWTRSSILTSGKSLSLRRYRDAAHLLGSCEQADLHPLGERSLTS